MAMPVSVALGSAVLLAAIESASLKNSGDAIAAEPTIMNFLLVKFKLDPDIIFFLSYYAVYIYIHADKTKWDSKI
jgi:hypothetical protein